MLNCCLDYFGTGKMQQKMCHILSKDKSRMLIYSVFVLMKHVIDSYTKMCPSLRLRCYLWRIKFPFSFFSMPSSSYDFLDILMCYLLFQGLISGSAELREQAALGLGELIEVTSEQALKPFVIPITGYVQ